MQDTEKKKKFPLTAKVCLPIWEELPKKQKCKAKPKGEQVSHCAALNFFFFFPLWYHKLQNHEISEITLTIMLILMYSSLLQSLNWLHSSTTEVTSRVTILIPETEGHAGSWMKVSLVYTARDNCSKRASFPLNLLKHYYTSLWSALYSFRNNTLKNKRKADGDSSEDSSMNGSTYKNMAYRLREVLLVQNKEDWENLNFLIYVHNIWTYIKKTASLDILYIHINKLMFICTYKKNMENGNKLLSMLMWIR